MSKVASKEPRHGTHTHSLSHSPTHSLSRGVKYAGSASSESNEISACCSNVWNTQRVINTGCSMEAVSRSSPMSTPFRMSTSRESLHTETPSHSSSFLRNEGVATLRVHARPPLRSTSGCRWCWTPISTASGSTRPTLHRTSAPTLHRRASPSLSRPTPPPSSWLLSQRRTHLQLSRSGANWVLIRLFPLPSPHAALPPWNWRRPILSPPARSLQSSILGGLSYLCCHGHRG